MASSKSSFTLPGDQAIDSIVIASKRSLTVNAPADLVWHQVDQFDQGYAAFGIIFLLIALTLASTKVKEAIEARNPVVETNIA